VRGQQETARPPSGGMPGRIALAPCERREQSAGTKRRGIERSVTTQRAERSGRLSLGKRAPRSQRAY